MVAVFCTVHCAVIVGRVSCVPPGIWNPTLSDVSMYAPEVLKLPVVCAVQVPGTKTAVLQSVTVYRPDVELSPPDTLNEPGTSCRSAGTGVMDR